MVSGGLGATDTGNRAAIGGYSREFFSRVRAHYVKKYSSASRQVKDCSDGFRFEPHVASLVFHEMLREAKVSPLFGQRLDRVVRKGARIVALTTLKKDEFHAAIFIDATYEGDLLARAGVKYHVGREGRTVYGEPLAGVLARSPAHQWPVKVSPFDRKGRLLPFVQPDKLAAPGSGDRKVQAYNFRLCMTDRKDNQVPFPRPAGYDPRRYELLARYLAARPGLKMGQLMNPVHLPNDKTDTNNNGPFSTDHIGASWDYPEANEATRARIWEDHVRYQQGFHYFLANDPRVPKALQAEVRRWGLAKDEFTDTNHWPPQLYVREARRMVGAYVMTQADLTERRVKDDSVGLGSYNADSHHVQRVVGPDGGALNEGDFQVAVRPYAIPYRSLTPRPAECENLLVPVCLSASHVAYGSIRMEPVYMVLGHASGVAAALAVEGKTSVQAVPYARLKAKLLAQKAVLSPEGLPGPAGKARALDPKTMPGVVVDDESAEKIGDWKRSTALGPYVGVGYLHDGNEAQGKMRARFVPRLPRPGRYEVRLHYPPADNRATNALVVVRHRDGEKALRVNQRRAPGANGLLLGTFELGPGSWVEVRNDGADGHVIADAVQFVPAR
jgi:hypothetical protein